MKIIKKIMGIFGYKLTEKNLVNIWPNYYDLTRAGHLARNSGNKYKSTK